MKAILAARRLCPWWLPWGVMACGDEVAERPPAPAARDSVGISIVENALSVWAPSEAWWLSPEPLVRIGRAQGDQQYLLLDVSGALRLPDGTIAVANSGTEEIRFFDPEGRYLRASGGRGDGPGEFGNLLWIYPRGEDTIVAWDDRPPAVEVLHRDGSFGRSVRVSEAGVLRGVFSDGSLLFDGRQQRMAGTVEGRLRLQRRALRVGPAGKIADSLPIFPGTEYFTGRFGGALISSSPPFGRETVFAVADDGFYAGSQDDFEVGLYDGRGVLRTLVRWPSRERTVTPTLIEAYRRDQLARIRSEERRRTAVAHLDRQEYPETLPAFGAIEVDGVGHLWVQEYPLPWEGTQRWIVFDPDHRMLGRVVMPARFVVHQIGESFVLGSTWDDLDVEYVELYRLVRSTIEDPRTR